MSKAEEKALEAYPDKEMNGVAMLFHEQRRLFQEGYEAAEKNLGWISVKDDLPKEEQSYLTFSEERGLCLTDWIDGEWRDEFNDKVSVDLWMVIPEFPEKK